MAKNIEQVLAESIRPQTSYFRQLYLAFETLSLRRWLKSLYSMLLFCVDKVAILLTISTHILSNVKKSSIYNYSDSDNYYNLKICEFGLHVNNKDTMDFFILFVCAVIPLLRSVCILICSVSLSPPNESIQPTTSYILGPYSSCVEETLRIYFT